jgi:hypothetical protein
VAVSVGVFFKDKVFHTNSWHSKSVDVSVPPKTVEELKWNFIHALTHLLIFTQYTHKKIFLYHGNSFAISEDIFIISNHDNSA